MKRMLRTVAVLIAVGLSSQHAQAVRGFLSGNKLYDYITGSDVTLQQDAVGYVGGVADAEESTPNKPRFCMPEQVSRGQARDIVRNYLSAHPELRHYSASSLVVNSFIAAFPCPK